MTDVLSPSQVRTFSDCEMRWFYEHLLGLPDPPTASLALDKAFRMALMTNFRHKLGAKEDIEIEGADLMRHGAEHESNTIKRWQ